VVGNFTIYNGNLAKKIVRLNLDGSIDTSFNQSNLGFSINTIGSGDVSRVAIQPDGKIFCVGSAGSYNGVDVKHIFRLNSNGTIDSTFDVSNTALTYSSGSSKDIILQSDGKVLIFDNGYSSNTNYILRLNANGSIDSSFNICTIDNQVSDINYQSDGKILVTGNFTNVNGTSLNRIVRLNSDGIIDTSFNVGSGFTNNWDEIIELEIQNDGKIIVTGSGSMLYNNASTKGLVRLNTDGSIDSTFNSGTGLSGQYVGAKRGCLIQSDGKLVVYGSFNKYNNETVNYITKLKTDGTRDFSFNNICKGFDLTNGLIFKTAALQPDGKILVGGTFTAYNGFTKSYLVRLNSDGSIDNTLTFGGGVGFQGNTGFHTINTIVVQSNGKILIGGDFGIFNGVIRNRIIRLNSDGTRDTTFVIGTGFDDEVKIIVLQSDGKILVGGNFNTYQGATCGGVIRLNINGSIDSSFNNTNVLGGNDCYSIALQSDGKVLVGGLINLSGPIQKGLVRLNVDGSKDFTFIPDASLNIYDIQSIILQQDSKFLIRGNYMLNGITHNSILRLNNNGTMDSTFSFELASNNNNLSINSFLLLPDNKILVTGWLGTLGTISFVKRINSNGIIDSSFNSIPNAYDSNAILQSDGKIILYGDFTSPLLSNRGITRLMGQEYSFIQGQNKLDLDNNGCDINDVVFQNLKLNITSSSISENYITNTSANYNIGVVSGTYTITPVLENPTYFDISPSSINVNFPTQTSPFTQNFCITPSGVHPDLEVVLIPIGAARPGFDAKYKLVYKNKGNQLQSGSVSINFDDAVLDYVSAAPIASTSSTNVKIWNFTNLNPYETREVLITLNLNTPVETPPLNGGSVLNYTTTITSAQTDDTPNDNTFALNQTVVNSYDPNDKTCMFGPSVGIDKVGEYAHYVIRFENSGTYNAENIKVTDVIDTNKFDINTLMPLSGSALFTTKISQGNKVEFKFDNINLPYIAGTNTGYVAFKIKTKSTLVVGDTFGGLANIYFDYNSAITTNTYTTTIQALSVQDFSFVNYFSLYPNPVSEVLNISKKEDIEISSVHIYNMLGQLMMVVPNAKNTNTIDVSNLSSGNYFLKINSDKGTSNTKFIKN
jgi:uncharacterized delta-60 repeat protein